MIKTTHHFLSRVAIVFMLCVFGMVSRAQDPGDPGPMAFTKQYYDFGDLAFDPPTFPVNVEVRGSVHHPTDMSGGPFPVVVILHGRHSTCYSGGSSALAWPCTGSYSPIDSYEGYDYLAEHLASWGYIVISVSANAISATDNSTADYGMQARGELVQYHLDLWNDWNTIGGAPFGSDFIGKLDLSNVGTMGHSRGGEGVVEHAIYNEEVGSPYGVNAVLTLAPVDFNRPNITGIAQLNVAPYCDGDVSDLQGVHFYDDVRYLDIDDTTPKYNIVMLGANHNFFNTTWTPGGWPAGTADDWGYVDGGQNDSQCGTSNPSNARYIASRQRNALKAYASAFFRLHLGGETAFAPILEVDDINPPASSTMTVEEIYVSYHPPVNKRVELNRLDLETTEVTNSLGEAVAQSGLVTYDICGDDWGEQYCIGAGAGAAQEPHNKNGGVAMLGLSQCQLQWDSADDWYENDLPYYLYDLSQFEAVQFRASNNFDLTPAGTHLDFRVELEDGSAATASLLVSAYSDAMYFPPGNWGTTLPRTMHNTIKIPLADFSGVDITDIRKIRFTFNETAAGTILISDLLLSSNENVELPPIAAFIGNPTSSCTGEISFTDQSQFNPEEWLWDFGDGETSTDPNPTHTYLTDGTYTVTLTVTNPAGTDVHTEVAYIIVDRPPAPSVVNDTVCLGETANLAAGPSSGGTLEWFDAEVDGSVIGTGTSFSFTPAVTTTYWVEESVSNPTLSVGPPTNAFGTGGYFTASDIRGIFFDAYTDFILESVRVYSAVTATRTVQILDGEGGSVVHTADILIPAGESVVTLDWLITPYTGYFFKITGGTVNLYRNSSGPSYPYTLAGICSITSSNAGTTPLDYYYFFYDWQVREPDCISERAEVTAVVNPLPTATVSGDVTIVGGTSTTLTAGGGVTYSWSPTTGLDDPTSSTSEASPTVTTTYTVTVTDENGCSSTAEVTVTVDGQMNIGKNDELPFSIHPNPTKGIVQIITTELNTPFEIEIRSADGKLVWTETISSSTDRKEIDLSKHERGVYLIQVSGSDFNYQEKIILE